MKKIILPILIIVILGGGAAVGLLSTRILDPLWNPFRPEPEKMIEKMVAVMEELKTFRAESNFELKIESKEKFTLKGEMREDQDVTDPQNIKYATNFGITLAMEGMEFTLGGESKAIGETAYFKLKTTPAFPMLEPYFLMMGIDLDQLKDKWIKVDEDSMKEIADKVYGEEYEEEYEKESEKQKEAQKELEELLKNKQLYLVKKELPDEKIGDVAVYHYLVALNKEETKKFIIELFKTWEEEEIGGNANIGLALEKEFLKVLDEFFGKIGEITGELWIGKKDNYLYKIKVEKEIDLAKFGGGGEGKTIITIGANFSNFNEPVKIEAPEEFKTIEEVLSPLIEKYQESASDSRSKARDARRQADLRQIQVALEMYYYDEGYYLRSKTMPTSIGTSLLTVPKDPFSNNSYYWLNNTSGAATGCDGEHYCVFAELEGGGYLAVSEKGSEELLKKPTRCPCR